MSVDVSDKFSNLNDHLANAAKVLGRSTDRLKVFGAIYQGKKRVKTQKDLQRATNLTPIRILQLARELAANSIIAPIKVNGLLAYTKDPFYSHHKRAILRLVSDPRKLALFPTKTNSGGTGAMKLVAVNYPRKSFDVTQITIDDFDDFRGVKKIPHGQPHHQVGESWFKAGLKKVIGETGTFTDWGGEKNDLWTTKVHLQGKRLACAFAFKGKGTKGVLTLKKLGKNSDQLPRLFKNDAQVFIVEYCGQVDQSVSELMFSLAVARSVMCQEKIYYCVVDGDDTQRIIKAYAKCFN